MSSHVREIDRALARADIDQIRHDIDAYMSVGGMYQVDADDHEWDDDPASVTSSITRVLDWYPDLDRLMACWTLLAISDDVESQTAFAIGVGDQLVAYLDATGPEIPGYPRTCLLIRVIAEARVNPVWRVMLATTNWHSCSPQFQAVIEPVISATLNADVYKGAPT